MFLILRNRTYHFRIKVPAELVSVIGKHEIRASLKTASKRDAKPIASRLAHNCRCIFIRLKLTPEKVLMEMVMARQLFDYSEGLDLIDKSPVPSLLVPKKKQGHARDERLAYTIDQLHEIFNPERFMRWVGYRGFDPAKFWIPVLALCSTGRLEEICGLRAVDVQSTGDGINLHITNHNSRLIKNDNSERVVPVIPSVAGRLREYAEQLPGDSMLFPGLRPAHGKLSHNFSKQWSRYVRQKVGIVDPLIAPAHSLRHFTIDLLSKALVPVPVIKAMDGHAPGGGETGVD